MSSSVLLGLGSNLDKPILQLSAALTHLNNHPEIEVIKTSSFYESLPQGPQDQANFINAVCLISTSLTPQVLLLELQKIEQLQGKRKIRHWGERCIDIDILFIDDLTLTASDPELTIPHPHALTRDFVLIPALEIAPDWKLPDKSFMHSHLDHCLQHELKKLKIDAKSS